LATAEQTVSAKYETAIGFTITASFWMVVATLAGLTTAIQFIAPDLLGNISWLSFAIIFCQGCCGRNYSVKN
jgi:cbb3-type cytochrome oxidase subunit 1